jgi:hypothetical protein
LQSTLGTQLNLSTTYHPEMDGKTERVNQVMEDMLRMYVMDNQTHWEKYLPLVEFTYNNNFHNSIGMSTLSSSVWKAMQDTIELGKVRRPSDSRAIIDSRDGGAGDSD